MLSLIEKISFHIISDFRFPNSTLFFSSNMYLKLNKSGWADNKRIFSNSPRIILKVIMVWILTDNWILDTDYNEEV
jgi:hypothetical protein